jgi:cytochrome c-type biogenesis protein CcmF
MTCAHLGVAVFIIGVTSVKSFEIERDVRMNPGDTVTVGSTTYRFDGVKDVPGPNYRAAEGTVTMLKNGVVERELHPQKRVYNVQQMPMTEAAIDTRASGDRYVSLGDPLEGGAWTLRVYSKPFVVWIWGGCLLMAFGGVLALTDRRYRALARRDERAPAGPQAAAA